MNNSINERILCAAVWYKDLKHKKDIPKDVVLPKNIDTGLVFCGFRHCHCMYTMVAITGLRSVEKAEDGVGEFVEGFLTSKNRFVNRREAFKIARKELQILDLQDTRGERLYSEDLY